MGRPEDDQRLWDWEIVATVKRNTRQGVITLEGCVTHRPDGWYMLTNHLTVP